MTPGLDDPALTWNRRFTTEGFLLGAEPNIWLRRHAGVWHRSQARW